MVAVNTNINLDQYETAVLFPVLSRAPGIYKTKMMIRGNSLLSSVYVKSIDPGATLKVNYYDTTTGSDGTLERYDLTGHDLITDTQAGETFRITVPRIHNKPQAEIIVTGGNVEFGIYITVVSTFVTDLDSALIRDGDTFEQTVHKAIPIACLDDITGTLNFLRCREGSLSVSEVGEEFHLWGSVQETPGTWEDILVFTVPANIERRITQAGVSTSSEGAWQLLIDGNIVASGRTSAGKPDAEKIFNPKKSVSSGLEVKLRFSGRVGGPTNFVDGFLMALDVEV